ncbi:MAG: hypothetical protein H0V20_06385 [Actinobacteria bacterium]|nr:hypothetical protein [Actinomycetota bacterium]
MLVAQTQEVEDALAAKDYGTARGQALDLQERVTAAIDAGRVPSSLQDELLAAVKDLVRLIPEETPEPEEDKEEDEDDKGKGKGNGKGKTGDKESATATVEDATTLAATSTTTASG